MVDDSRTKRPLSPHLTIYRPQLTSISSILTRITGNGLLLGAVLVSVWFMSLVISPACFAAVNGFMTSWFGDLIMTGSLWALWYHLLAGIRHLIWDTGRGLEIETAEMLGWGVIGGSVFLTILTIVII
ncbi:MAG: succinate dehydrogenase, cytochrome b556 subunit [Paracoccaceae bacterium]